MNKRFKNKNYIQYSNVFEDANSVLESVPEYAENVLMISGAGDNALSVLTKDIKRLVVIDKNNIQLNLAKLKFKAFELLEYDELLILLGINKGDSIKVYNKIRNNLDQMTRDYFDLNINLISKIKIINAGRFEYYFQKFKKILPFIVSSKRINTFMNMNNTLDQVDYFNKYIMNKRFRFLSGRFFSSKKVSEIGREKEYFLYAEDDLADHIMNRFKECISNSLNKENPYLQYVIYNKYYELPYYLKKENFLKIKENIKKAEFINCDIKKIENIDIKFDFMGLSDIFEYLSMEETGQIEKIIHNKLNNKGVVLFWNMIVDRKFHTSFIETDTSDLFKKEKAYFYQALNVYIKE